MFMSEGRLGDRLCGVNDLESCLFCRFDGGWQRRERALWISDLMASQR